MGAAPVNTARRGVPPTFSPIDGVPLTVTVRAKVAVTSMVSPGR